MAMPRQEIPFTSQLIFLLEAELEQLEQKNMGFNSLLQHTQNAVKLYGDHAKDRWFRLSLYSNMNGAKELLAHISSIPEDIGELARKLRLMQLAIHSLKQAIKNNSTRFAPELIKVLELAIKVQENAKVDDKIATAERWCQIAQSLVCLRTNLLDVNADSLVEHIIHIQNDKVSNEPAVRAVRRFTRSSQQDKKSDGSLNGTLKRIFMDNSHKLSDEANDAFTTISKLLAIPLLALPPVVNNEEFNEKAIGLAHKLMQAVIGLLKNNLSWRAFLDNSGLTADKNTKESFEKYIYTAFVFKVVSNLLMHEPKTVSINMGKYLNIIAFTKDSEEQIKILQDEFSRDNRKDFIVYQHNPEEAPAEEKHETPATSMLKK